jgi:hypothetical protein
MDGINSPFNNGTIGLNKAGNILECPVIRLSHLRAWLLSPGSGASFLLSSGSVSLLSSGSAYFPGEQHFLLPWCSLPFRLFV